MGDVLTGAIAGLMAQGMGPEAATTCGVYLHGAAADRLAAQYAAVGFLAGDLLEVMPKVMQDLRNGGPEAEYGFTRVL
jgi:NAD(P)H-hydrate epimerase